MWVMDYALQGYLFPENITSKALGDFSWVVSQGICISVKLALEGTLLLPAINPLILICFIWELLQKWLLLIVDDFCCKAFSEKIIEAMYACRKNSWRVESNHQAVRWEKSFPKPSFHLAPLGKCCIYLYIHVSRLHVYICAYTSKIMFLSCQVEVIEVKHGCLYKSVTKYLL